MPPRMRTTTITDDQPDGALPPKAFTITNSAYTNPIAAAMMPSEDMARMGRKLNAAIESTNSFSFFLRFQLDWPRVLASFV